MGQRLALPGIAGATDLSGHDPTDTDERVLQVKEALGGHGSLYVLKAQLVAWSTLSRDQIVRRQGQCWSIDQLVRVPTINYCSYHQIGPLPKKVIENIFRRHHCGSWKGAASDS